MTIASKRQSPAPTPAASDGVATPPYRAYITPRMMTTNGAIFGTDVNFSFQVYRKSGACERKPLRQIANIDHSMNRLVSIRPGNTPATNRRPIDDSVAIPYRMKVTDGGIRIPKVPPAQIEPVAISSG